MSAFVLVFVFVSLVFDCEFEPLPDPLFDAGALGPNLPLPRPRRLWRDMCIPPRESIPGSLQEPEEGGKITNSISGACGQAWTGVGSRAESELVAAGGVV